MSNSLSKVGIGAGLVTRDTEDTNLFSVATNVPGNQEVNKGFKTNFAYSLIDSP